MMKPEVRLIDGASLEKEIDDSMKKARDEFNFTAEQLLSIFKQAVQDQPTIEPEVRHGMTIDQLNSITSYLKEKVWRNADVMYMQSDNQGVEEVEPADLVDIISSLHNLLYEAVTGKRYDYAFHWCNKVGAWTEDNIFDEIMKGEKDNDSE